ncbi:MAG: hypothetical protein C0402_00605 [Thermodesulfovibrio sp.]|nr:hypothetical protein [Thermodesulfovibrio sp.]
MHSIFLDMRGKALRVLSAEGISAPYTRIFEPFEADPSGLNQALKQVSEATRLQFDKAHLIVPSEEVTVSKYKIPNMPLPDAEKVIRRKLIAEFKIDEPVFHLTALDADKRQRTYLVELVRPEVVQKYVKLLAGAKLKIRTITSSFNANIGNFRGSSLETPETSGIFDIDNEAIEVTILSRTDVIYAERISLTYPGEEQEHTGDAMAERAQKMKLYRIMDAIYKVHLSYQELYPDNAIQKIWLCGLKGGAEGVSDALQQAMDAEIISGDDSRPEGYAYSALFGLSAGLSVGTAVNFVTKKSLRQLSERTVRLFMGIAACLALASMIYGYTTYESRYRQESALLEKAQKEHAARQVAGKQVSPYLTHQDEITALERTQVVYYDIFKFVANRIPEGIVLEKISFRRDQSKGLLDLVFLAPHNPKAGSERLLTKLTGMVNELDVCRRHQEPVITVVARDKEKILRVEFLCEAYAIEKKN